MNELLTDNKYENLSVEELLSNNEYKDLPTEELLKRVKKPMYEILTDSEYQKLSKNELIARLKNSGEFIYEMLDHSHNILMSNFELGQDLRKIYTEHFLCETALNELKLEFEKLNPDNTNHQINYIIKSHDYFVDIYRTLKKDFDFMNDFLVGVHTSELDCKEEIKQLKKKFNRKEIFEKINELLKEKGE